MYSMENDSLYVNLYAVNETDVELQGGKGSIHQKTEYPWDEKITLNINPKTVHLFTIDLRIPGWCDQPELRDNRERININEVLRNGYAYIQRSWETGDEIELFFPMPGKRMKSHPEVGENAGKVALQRGPVVFCLEEVDNGSNLSNIYLDKNSAFDV